VRNAQHGAVLVANLSVMTMINVNVNVNLYSALLHSASTVMRSRIEYLKPPREFEHQDFFVVLDEWSITEPRECTQSIPSHVNVGFVKTENPAKIRPCSRYKIMTV